MRAFEVCRCAYKGQYRCRVTYVYNIAYYVIVYCNICVYVQVRERCRKGIPPSVRPRAWLYLCASKENKKMYPPRYFENLCALEGNPRCVEDIKKDLHRQFPYHEIFIEQEGHGSVCHRVIVLFIGDQPTH